MFIIEFKIIENNFNVIKTRMNKELDERNE